MKNLLLFTLLLFASLVSTAQNPWLVDPDNGDDATADGSAALPYQTIPAAADAALAGGGGEVHIKGGDIPTAPLHPYDHPGHRRGLGHHHAGTAPRNP